MDEEERTEAPGGHGDGGHGAHGRRSPTHARKAAKGEVTLDMIRRSTTLRKFHHETDEHFFDRITNLSLHGKRLRRISGLERCSRLRVLFLYNNELTKMENLGFAKQLTHLYLENNQLTQIEDLRGLRNLCKLSLSGNKIAYVDGLEGCCMLQELHLDNQRLEPGQALEFDAATMDALSESLQTLTVGNTNLLNLRPLYCLANLHVLKAADNQIQEIKQVVSLLATCSLLVELDLQGNPVCNEPRYRDVLVMQSELLQTIDDKPVKPNQRAFLQARERQRQRQSDRQQRTRALHAAHSHAARNHPERLQPGGPGGQLAPGFVRRADAGNRFVSKTPLRRAPRAPSPRRSQSAVPADSGFSDFLSVGALSIAKSNPARRAGRRADAL